MQKACGANRRLLQYSLQSSLDLLDHILVLCIGQVSLSWIHGKRSAPLELTLILGNQMKVQMAAAVAIGAVVYLIGVEYLVDGIGSSGHVSKEQVPLLIRNIHQFGNMILVCYDHTAGVALLLEEEQLADLQVADLDAEFCQRLAADTVAAIAVFHKNYLFPNYNSSGAVVSAHIRNDILFHPFKLIITQKFSQESVHFSANSTVFPVHFY